MADSNISDISIDMCLSTISLIYPNKWLFLIYLIYPKHVFIYHISDIFKYMVFLISLIYPYTCIYLPYPWYLQIHGVSNISIYIHIHVFIYPIPDISDKMTVSTISPIYPIKWLYLGWCLPSIGLVDRNALQ